MANEGVEIKISGIAGAGRGVFACRDFAPGDVVVLVERPLVAELEVERMLDTCAWCFQHGEADAQRRAQAASMGLPAGFVEVKACTGCKRVVYCSKTCQSKAWKREHKYECKVISAPGRPDLPYGVRAAIKLLGRLQAGPEAEKKQLLDFLTFKPAGDPRGLSAILSEKRVEDFNTLAQAAWVYFGQPAKVGETDGKKAAQGFLYNFMLNAFDLASPLESERFGAGFDTLICAANHSCEPNVVMSFLQPAVDLRALRPIKKGEEIFVKYVDVSNPFSVRQAQLKRDYFFSCQCTKCSKGAVFAEDKLKKPTEELPKKYQAQVDELAKRHAAVLDKFYVPAHDETAQKRLAAMQAEAFGVMGTAFADPLPIDTTGHATKAALRLCLESGMFSLTRQPVAGLCRQLFSIYLANGDFYRAFRMGLKLYFEITPVLTPQVFYPDRLIDTWALMTVSNVLCSPTNAEINKDLLDGGLDLRMACIGFVFDVHEQLPKMYGPASPFGRVVDNTYKQIIAGMDASEEELKKKVKEAWPLLETAARSFDILAG